MKNVIILTAASNIPPSTHLPEVLREIGNIAEFKAKGKLGEAGEIKWKMSTAGTLRYLVSIETYEIKKPRINSVN